MLNDGSADSPLDNLSKSVGGKVAKVTVRMSPMHADALARRARAADVAQGLYVCGLLDAIPAPPLPADHSTAVAALCVSTDRVAAMSADLNAFLPVLERVPEAQLDRYREGLKSLAGDMRAHLATASVLIAALTPSRRPWR